MSSRDQEEYLNKVRDVSEGIDRLHEKLQRNPDSLSSRQAGYLAVNLFLIDTKIERIRQRNFQEALGEMGQIRDEATDDIARLGAQGGGR